VIDRPRFGIVYLVRNRISGKCYVGQTIHTLGTRWADHRAKAKRGSRCPLHASIRKHGEEAFEVDVLEQVTREELDAAEVRWAIKMNAFVPNGYTLKAGGGNSTRISDQLRQQLSRETTNQWSDRDSRRNLQAAIRIARADPAVKKRVASGAIRGWSTSGRRAVWPEIVKAQWADPDARRRREIGMARANNSSGHRNSISEANRRRWRDPKYRELRVAQINAQWRNPEVRDRMIRRMKGSKMVGWFWRVALAEAPA
jgi:hypothetical protein